MAAFAVSTGVCSNPREREREKEGESDRGRGCVVGEGWQAHDSRLATATPAAAED